MAKTARLNYFATRSTFINERYVQGAFLHAAAMPLLHPISHVVEIIFEVTTKDTFVNKLYLQKDDEGDGWGQKLTILNLKYGSEEKGSSLCKCSILLSFLCQKN